VSGGTDVDLHGLTTRLKLIGKGDIVPEKTVARHLYTNHPCQHRPGVDSYSHLQKKNNHKIAFSISINPLSLSLSCMRVWVHLLESADRHGLRDLDKC